MLQGLDRVREGASSPRFGPDANKCGGGYLTAHFKQLILCVAFVKGTFGLFAARVFRINSKWLLR